MDEGGVDCFFDFIEWEVKLLIEVCYLIDCSC